MLSHLPRVTDHQNWLRIGELNTNQQQPGYCDDNSVRHK